MPAGKGKGGKGGKVGKSKKAPQSRSMKAGLQVLITYFSNFNKVPSGKNP